jgi:hypothetical protein
LGVHGVRSGCWWGRDAEVGSDGREAPGSVAQRLYAARDAGAGQAEQERILAEGLREHYFKDNGHRASGLDVELNDIAWMDVEGI